MSDSISWFVDLDASLAEAKELAERVSAWLVTQGIVSPLPCQAPGGSHLLSRGESAALWDSFPHAFPDYAARAGFTSTPHIVRLMYLSAHAPRIHDDPLVDRYLRKPGATPEQRLDDLDAVMKHKLKGDR